MIVDMHMFDKLLLLNKNIIIGVFLDVNIRAYVLRRERVNHVCWIELHFEKANSKYIPLPM